MQKIIFVLLLLSAASLLCRAQSEADTASVGVTPLTYASFSAKVADVSQKEWKYLGDKPAIINFYADWCVYCRQMSPSLSELADQYSDKLYIYKINMDTEPRLSRFFGVRSVPYTLFVPMSSDPQYLNGAIPKVYLEEIVKDMLGLKSEAAGSESNEAAEAADEPVAGSAK
ncbi:MAG: thioredoxin family protein [Tannerellaceae bacterium]|jgi:thioredoxin-like negative regulator of GroEL|nr:thioredoxin family protein [Tannerellaceae bacterium]